MFVLFIIISKDQFFNTVHIFNGDKKFAHAVKLNCEVIVIWSTSPMPPWSRIEHNLISFETVPDVNECEEFGICDHKCVNLVGGHQCFCDPGYALASDKKTCKAEGNNSSTADNTYFVEKTTLFISIQPFAVYSF